MTKKHVINTQWLICTPEQPKDLTHLNIIAYKTRGFIFRFTQFTLFGLYAPFSVYMVRKATCRLSR